MDYTICNNNKVVCFTVPEEFDRIEFKRENGFWRVYFVQTYVYYNKDTDVAVDTSTVKLVYALEADGYIKIMRGDTVIFDKYDMKLYDADLREYFDKEE